MRLPKIFHIGGSGRPRTPPRPILDKWSFLGVGVLAGMALAVAEGARSKARAPLPTGLDRSRDSARSPASLSPKSWWAVLSRTYKEFNADHIPAVAGGATFFSLLAMFPALGVFVSLYGLFGDVAKARSQIVGLAGFLPEGGVTVLTQQLDHLTAVPSDKLGLTFVTSLVLSIWSANAGVKSLIAGLNIAFEQQERRKFFALNLQSLAITVGAIGTAVLGTIAVAASQRTLAFLNLADLEGVSLLRWPLLLIVITCLVSILYRYGPSKRRTRWRWITPGGIFAGVTWIGVSFLFSVYVNNFGSYDKTYGSLGAVVGFMTWIWLTLSVILAGAELNCELERQVSPGPAPTAGHTAS